MSDEEPTDYVPAMYEGRVERFRWPEDRWLAFIVKLGFVIAVLVLIGIVEVAIARLLIR